MATEASRLSTMCHHLGTEKEEEEKEKEGEGRRRKEKEQKGVVRWRQC